MLFILSTRHLVDSTNHEMAIPTPGGAVAPHGDPHILKPAAHREVFEALRHRQAKEREIRQKWLDSVRKELRERERNQKPKADLELHPVVAHDALLVSDGAKVYGSFARDGISFCRCHQKFVGRSRHQARAKFGRSVCSCPARAHRFVSAGISAFRAPVSMVRRNRRPGRSAVPVHSNAQQQEVVASRAECPRR